MDFLTVSLCMSIGTAVAWLFALYTPRGSYLLFWNTFFGMAGAFLCLWAIAWMSPTLRLVVLVIAAPLCAAVTIVVGNAVRRAIGEAIRGRLSR